MRWQQEQRSRLPRRDRNRKIHLPVGKEKARIHTGLWNFGDYGKMKEVSTVNYVLYF